MAACACGAEDLSPGARRGWCRPLVCLEFRQSWEQMHLFWVLLGVSPACVWPEPCPALLEWGSAGAWWAIHLSQVKLDCHNKDGAEFCLVFFPHPVLLVAVGNLTVAR